jgi:hypothetical protein
MRQMRVEHHHIICINQFQVIQTFFYSLKKYTVLTRLFDLFIKKEEENIWCLRRMIMRTSIFGEYNRENFNVIRGLKFTIFFVFCDSQVIIKKTILLYAFIQFKCLISKAKNAIFTGNFGIYISRF